jgi:hypothetical protein
MVSAVSAAASGFFSTTIFSGSVSVVGLFNGSNISSTSVEFLFFSPCRGTQISPEFARTFTTIFPFTADTVSPDSFPM